MAELGQLAAKLAADVGVRDRDQGLAALAQGEAVIFPNRYRPVAGSRGAYRVTVRHGVSDVRSGERRTLGIIFHDAE